MTHASQNELRSSNATAAAFLPPATVAETGWDVLLALHSDPRCELTLGKLAALASDNPDVLNQWLSILEQRRIISGATHQRTGEGRVVLTTTGRDLIDRYLAATCSLQTGTRH